MIVSLLLVRFIAASVTRDRIAPLNVTQLWLQARCRKARDAVAAYRAHPDLPSDLNRHRRKVERVVVRIANELLHLQGVRFDLDHTRCRHGEPSSRRDLLAGTQQRSVRSPSEIVESKADRNLVSL